MYLDDYYLVARPDVFDCILKKLSEEFGKVGLEMKDDKSRAWCVDPAALTPFLLVRYC